MTLPAKALQSTSAQDVAEIVAKLTKAQREAVLRMSEQWQRPSRETFSHGAAWGAHWSFKSAIDRRRVGRTAQLAHDEFRLLPLGLQVRASLTSKESHNG